MENFQDTFEARKQSIYQYFFNLHDCTFKETELRLSYKWKKSLASLKTLLLYSIKIKYNTVIMMRV